MISLLLHLLRLLPFLFGGHRQLALENLALREQLAVYRRTVTRPKLRTTDRLFWAVLARIWAGWRRPLVIVTPDTVLRWQRRRFREYWTTLSARPTGGRPPIKAEIKALVSRMVTANPLWGVAASGGRERQRRDCRGSASAVLDLDVVPRLQPASVLADALRVLPSLAILLATHRRSRSAHGVTDCGVEIEASRHALSKWTRDVEERLLLWAEPQPLRLRIAKPLGGLERQVDPHCLDTWEDVSDRWAVLPLPVMSVVPVVVELLALASSGHADIFSRGQLRPPVNARARRVCRLGCSRGAASAAPRPSTAARSRPPPAARSSRGPPPQVQHARPGCGACGCFRHDDPA
jgi:hypothetical protein